MSGQNTTEVFRKHLMTIKVRIKAWQEKGVSATNMANCLGLQGCLGGQKLTKVCLSGLSVLCPGGSLASSRMGKTSLRPFFTYRFWYLSLRKFFAFGGFFFVTGNHVFWPLCIIFLEAVSCFSHEWLKISLIQQFKKIPNIYMYSNYTFYVLKMWLKNFLTFWLGIVYQFLRHF
jgi:hypothetical protein